MTALAERLHEAMANRDVGELAAKVGVTRVTVYRWLSAKFDPGVVKLGELAEALDVSLAWLITGGGPMQRRRALLHARLADYVPTEYTTSRGSSDRPPIVFHESWLSEFLYGPRETPTLVSGDMIPPLLVNAPDDSMEPTISRGSLVLVDRSFGIPQMTRDRDGAGLNYDGIYLFRLEPARRGSKTAQPQLLIRRVLYKLDGTMIVRCDNSTYPEETFDTRNRPTPIGRAVWHADRF